LKPGNPGGGKPFIGKNNPPATCKFPDLTRKRRILIQGEVKEPETKTSTTGSEGDPGERPER